MRTITLLFLLMISSLPAMGAGPAATVNGHAITTQEVDRALLEFAASQGATMDQVRASPQFPQLRKAVLNSLVERELLWQAARSSHQVDDKQLGQALGNVRSQLGGAQRFQQALQAQGLTESALADRLRRDLTIQAYLSQRVYAEVQVSEADIESFYQANKDQFRSPDLLHLRDLIVPAAAQPDAQRAASQWYEKLQSGADFRQMARKHSADFSARNGGDLGFLNAEDLGPKLAPVARELEVGAVSPPHEGPDGLHLLQLVARRPGVQASLAEVHDLIRDHLLQSRRDSTLQQTVEALRKKAKIKFAP